MPPRVRVIGWLSGHFDIATVDRTVRPRGQSRGLDQNRILLAATKSCDRDDRHGIEHRFPPIDNRFLPRSISLRAGACQMPGTIGPLPRGWPRSKRRPGSLLWDWL